MSMTQGNYVNPLLSCCRERFKWFQYHQQKYREISPRFIKDSTLTVREYFVVSAYREDFNNEQARELLRVSKTTLNRIKRTICEKVFTKNFTCALIIVHQQEQRNKSENKLKKIEINSKSGSNDPTFI